MFAGKQMKMAARIRFPLRRRAGEEVRFSVLAERCIAG
jgi:hypothetical protein